MTRYLSLPGVPTYLGFDPRLQVVHERDGLDALAAAVARPVRGAVNVAGPGTIGLTRMIRLARRPPLPLAGPLFGSVTAARRAGPGWRRCRRTSGGCCATGAAWTLTRLVRRGGLHAHASPRRRPCRTGRDTRAGMAIAPPARAAALSTHARHAHAAASRALAAAPDALRGVGTAIAFLRRLREGLDGGRRPARGARARAAALPRERAEALGWGAGGSTGDYSEDEWGFDEEFAEIVQPLFDFLYDRWWRVEVEGSRTCPRTAARSWWPTTRASCPGTPR